MTDVDKEAGLGRGRSQTWVQPQQKTSAVPQGTLKPGRPLRTLPCWGKETGPLSFCVEQLWDSGCLDIRMLDLASKNTQCSVTFEFQINNDQFFNPSVSHIIFGTCLYEKLFAVYLTFKFNRVSCILSGNPTRGGSMVIQKRKEHLEKERIWRDFWKSVVFKQGPYGQAGFGHTEMDSPREHSRGAPGWPCTWARHPLPQQIPKEADSRGRTVGSTSRSWVINPSVLKGHLGVHLSIHDRHTSPPTGHHWELAVIGSQVGVHGLL